MDANAREIDLNRIDNSFAREVAGRHGGEHISLCYACGACSARCPVGELDPEFDPRRLIRMVILGLKEQVLQNAALWHCSTCFTCQETCPQQVNFTEVLFALKNMAAEKGYFPAGMNAQADLLKTHGRLYEIGEFENDKRRELGLPELEEKPGHFKIILKNFRLSNKEEG